MCVTAYPLLLQTVEVHIHPNHSLACLYCTCRQTLALYRPSALYTYTFSHPWAVVFRPIVSAAASKAGDGGEVHQVQGAW